MRCDDIRGELSAFLAGEPSEDGWESVRTHIGGCTPCAEACAGMRRIWTGLGDVKMAEVPAGALKQLEERIREASRAEARARGGYTWVLGLADAMLGAIALYLISRVLPVSAFCRLCTSTLKGTGLEGWIYTGEFTSGTVVSALSILVALFVGRLAWSRESSGRLAAAGFGYALIAILAGPHHVVVGNTFALTAWCTGSALGTLAMVLTIALFRSRTVSSPSA